MGASRGWASKEYREALRTVDRAMHSVLDIYQEQGLTKRTTLFVTSLSAEGRDANQEQADAAVPMVPWIASGVGIKPGHAIHQPVSILDTGATVMRTLGLQTHTEWESHAVEEIFQAAFVAAPRGSVRIGHVMQNVKWYMGWCLVGGLLGSATVIQPAAAGQPLPIRRNMRLPLTPPPLILSPGGMCPASPRRSMPRTPSLWMPTRRPSPVPSN